MAKKRILVVDDDPKVLQQMVDTLAQEGYAVTGTPSPQQALALALAQGAKFDLMVTDMAMPGIEGADLLSVVRQQVPEIVGVVITGYATVERAIDSLKAGAQYFLAKPFTPQEFKAAVKEALGKSRLAREGAREKTLMPLFETSKLLQAETDLEKLFELIVQRLAEEIQVDLACLISLEGGEAIIKAAVGLPRKAIHTVYPGSWGGVVGWVLRTGQPLLLGRGAETGPGVEDGLAVPMATTTLSLPLMVRGGVSGAILALRYGENQDFNLGDLEVAYVLGQQAAIAIENASLLREVKAQQQRLERLLARVQRVQEEERRRISVEIHDSAAQWMSAALFRIQTCKTLLARSRMEEASGEIEQVKATVEQSLRELRRLVAGLHPPLLHQGGLIPALRHSLEEFQKETGVTCSFYCQGEFNWLSSPQELALYRIVQEASNNVRKHAEASQVSLRLLATPKGLKLEIEDNGKGFDPSLDLESQGEFTHIGLLGMRERAEMLGAVLEVESAPGRGTKIGVAVPIVRPSR